MSTKLKKTILGDATNIYNNYSSFADLPKLTKSTSLSLSKGYDTSKPHLAIFSDSTMDDTLSNSSNNTGSCPSSYDYIGDNSDVYSSCSYENNLEDGCTILNSALSQKKKAVPDDTKYKTELCKNWTETGKCNYGKKCKFAHGKHELNEKSLLNKARYKSKKCNSFFSTSYCPYGVRCLFAHEQRQSEDINSDFYYQKYIIFPDFRDCPETKNNRTLPVFRNLHSEDQGSEYFAEDECDYAQDRNLWEAFNSKERVCAKSESSKIYYNLSFLNY